jgi:hypothetical protein
LYISYVYDKIQFICINFEALEKEIPRVINNNNNNNNDNDNNNEHFCSLSMYCLASYLYLEEEAEM